MNIPIPTARDILTFRQDGGFLTVASDTLGAIGSKPNDRVRIDPETCGRMTARVCLMETLAVGAIPFALTALTCNEHDPTGAHLLAGIMQELADAGFKDLPVGGSTEDNMPTDMTALGLAILGACDRLSWRLARAGDMVYLLGRPYVGQEVLEHLTKLPTSSDILRLRELSHVGDVIPCGSRGIGWELRVLELETGLSVNLGSGIDEMLLKKSAGPATCAIITSNKQLTYGKHPLIHLGTLSQPSHNIQR